METALRAFLIAAAVIVAFFVGASVGQRSDGVGDFAGELFGGSDDAELSSEALDVIDESYFREVDSERARGRVGSGDGRRAPQALQGPLLPLLRPGRVQRFQAVTSGRFSGVGLTVTEVKQGLRVATVFDDSPAKEAGIEEGDIVTAVDGKSIAGKDAELATGADQGQARDRGDADRAAPLDEARRKDYTLERRELVVPAVETKLEEAGGRPVGYVRLLGFSRGAHAELRQEVERLDERGAEGLVIDLRGNGGGLLDEAVLTSSVFVEDGAIVSTKGRTQPDKTFEAVGDAVEPRPTVVLINGDTASASEIFTAALSDAGLAEVVGEKSFGKGVFQEVIPLENGGALDLTVGEYLTRDGVSLAGDGIEPEVPAVDEPEDEARRGPAGGARRARRVSGLPAAIASTTMSPRRRGADRRVAVTAKRGRFLVAEPMFERDRSGSRWPAAARSAPGGCRARGRRRAAARCVEELGRPDRAGRRARRRCFARTRWARASRAASRTRRRRRRARPSGRAPSAGT